MSLQDTASLSADPAGFPLQIFSYAVCGSEKDDRDFYRHAKAQQNDTRSPRSAGGKQQNIVDFYSLDSNS